MTESRQVRAEEFDEAYAIVCEVTQWLLDKGSTQWRRPLAREVYAKRQERGHNFGLWQDGTLAVVVSITDDRPDYWGDDLPGDRFAWLATRAARVSMKGRGLGAQTVALAEQHVSNSGLVRVCLDCHYGVGFLPSYYQRLDYRVVCRRTLFGNPGYDSALMTKELRSSGDRAS